VFAQMSIASIRAIPVANSFWDVLPSPPAILPSACVYSTSTGGFTCPPDTTSNSPTTSHATFLSYFLYDAAGHLQSTADSATTASVRTVIDESGSLDIEGPSAQPSRHLSSADATPSSFRALGRAIFGVHAKGTYHEEMTLSGLLTPARTLSGTGTWALTQGSFGSFSSSSSSVDETSTTANVILPRSTPGKPAACPRSGTITSDVRSSSTSSAPPRTFSDSSTRHDVVTFNGTSSVTIKRSATGSVMVADTIVDLSKAQPACSAQ
jgi:hypothetical protein